MKSRLRGGAAGAGIVGPRLTLLGEGPTLARETVQFAHRRIIVNVIQSINDETGRAKEERANDTVQPNPDTEYLLCLRHHAK